MFLNNLNILLKNIKIELNDDLKCKAYNNISPTSYYKVVVFIVPLQGLNAIIFTDAVD
jgi:hypothetical protein